MEQMFLLILANAAVSFTISWTSIFKGVRGLVGSLHPKLDELIHCPYCLGHYTALVLMLIEGSYYQQGLERAILHWFTIVGGTALCHFVMLRAYKPVMKAEMSRKFGKSMSRK